MGNYFRGESIEVRNRILLKIADRVKVYPTEATDFNFANVANLSAFDHLDQLFDACDKFPNLTRCDLSWNHLGENNVDSILQFVGKHKLKHLILAYNYFHGVGGDNLLKHLLCDSTLHSLHLGGCHIGDGGADAIKLYLRKNQSLTGLKIGDSGFSTQGAVLIMEALGLNNHLVHLDYRLNVLSPEAMKALDVSLSTRTEVLNLTLSSCTLVDDAFECLCRVISSNHYNLQGISLDGMKMGNLTTNGYLDLLSSALLKNKMMKTINLSSLGLTSSNFSFLINILEENVGLETIILTNNNLVCTEDEMLRFFRSFERNSSLKRIDMERTNIFGMNNENKSAWEESFIEVLNINQSLMHFDVNKDGSVLGRRVKDDMYSSTIEDILNIRRLNVKFIKTLPFRLWRSVQTASNRNIFDLNFGYS